jgi:hypothetical protein
VCRQSVRAVVLAAVLLGFLADGVPTVQLVERGSARTTMPDGATVKRKIKRYQRMTWRWQRLMGMPRTHPGRGYLHTTSIEYRLHVLKVWKRRAHRMKRRAHNPPNERSWRCLQRHEGPWRDAWDPYWGGLQMDRTFMRQYAPRFLLRRGWANTWTPVEQMWVAERAVRAGRGFYPWPNTARMCGLI